jgi:5,5'-dehydrodivanillate O-demethylase oxygenase subunit
MRAMNDSGQGRNRDHRLDWLHQTAADTPMGKLMRSFWQPIAIAKDLAPGQALPIRVLSEDLTLYRGETGTPFLVGGRCAHRCTVLHTGWVEADRIRCMYHGWQYDGTGQCTQMPAERRPRPEQARIPAYPVHEYAGLIFAYMGPSPVPEFQLPRKDCLEEDRVFLFHRKQVWDCNWFQQIENSLDASHVSFAHVWGKVSRFGQEITTAIPELSYEETSAGIRQVAKRSENNIRVSDWTFPNNNHVVAPGPLKTDPWVHTVVWAVPIDDETTMRFTIGAFPSRGTAEDDRISEAPHRNFDPADHYKELFETHNVPDAGWTQLIATQDYVALRGQGRIVDRSEEMLMQSDLGVATLRRIFLRELEAAQAGKPCKDWRKLAVAAELPIPERA